MRSQSKPRVMAPPSVYGQQAVDLDTKRTVGDVYLGDQNFLFECMACGRRAMKRPGELKGFPDQTLVELKAAVYCSSCGNADIKIKEVIWARERKNYDSELGPDPTTLGITHVY